MTKLSPDKLLWMYETMLVIRRYEETLAQVYLEGKLPPHIQQGLAFDIASGPVPGEMHLAAGQGARHLLHHPERLVCRQHIEQPLADQGVAILI